MWRGLRVLAMLVTFIALSGALFGQETYELKIKCAKGDKLTVVEKTEFSMKMKEVGPDGKVVREGSVGHGTDDEYAQEVLDAKEDKPVKFQRKYHHSRQSDEGPGMESPQLCTSLLHGRLYRVDLGAGEAVVECLNAKLGDADREDLVAVLENENERDLCEMLLPKKAVAVGEEWELDQEQLGRSKQLGENGPVTVTKATGKLLGIENVKGRRCAKIKYTLVMTQEAGPMIMTISLEGTGLFALKEGRWLTVEIEGPASLSTPDPDAAGARTSGEGRLKIVHKCELGVADLKGGEKPSDMEERFGH